jgi:replicative DNA helicase
VRDRAIERELIIGAAAILRSAQQPSGLSSTELVEEAERVVYAISDKRTTSDAHSMTELMSSALDSAEKVQAAKADGREIESPSLATQYTDLDRLLSGGFWPGELIIIAGRPGMGKTTFAINIARKMSIGNEKTVKPTAIFSLEMPREQVAKNILCAEAQLSAQRMRRFDFSPEEYEDLKFYGKQLQAAPMYIDDTSGLSLSALRARCRRLKHRKDVRMIVVDYLQLMQGPPGRQTNREQEVAEISRGLKAIARELEIPVVVLSQLNRSAEKRDNDKRPQLSDLRESGSIEQDADVVIMLYRDEYYDPEKNAEAENIQYAMVLKNRNGPVGNVKLTFRKDILRFESYTPNEHAAGE